MHRGDRSAIVKQVARIDVHKDRLSVRLKSPDMEDPSASTDDQVLSIPWQKPPSRQSRQILLPHHASRTDVRPIRIEKRAALVAAIARSRRWLDQIVSGQVTELEQIATREKCSVRHVNMTISLAFLAPERGLPDIFFRNNSAAVGSRGGAYSSGAAVFWNRLSL
jgi:hypothetical protein